MRARWNGETCSWRASCSSDARSPALATRSSIASSTSRRRAAPQTVDAWQPNPACTAASTSACRVSSTSSRSGAPRRRCRASRAQARWMRASLAAWANGNGAPAGRGRRADGRERLLHERRSQAEEHAAVALGVPQLAPVRLAAVVEDQVVAVRQHRLAPVLGDQHRRPGEHDQRERADLVDGPPGVGLRRAAERPDADPDALEQVAFDDRHRARIARPC